MLNGHGDADYIYIYTHTHDIFIGGRKAPSGRRELEKQTVNEIAMKKNFRIVKQQNKKPPTNRSRCCRRLQWIIITIKCLSFYDQPAATVGKERKKNASIFDQSKVNKIIIMTTSKLDDCPSQRFRHRRNLKTIKSTSLVSNSARLHRRPIFNDFPTFFKWVKL
jgi:hypothetical protein